MHRVDSPHTKNFAPHIISASEQIVLRMLCKQIDKDEIGCREAGSQLSQFPFIARRLIEEVHDRMPRHSIRIDDPSHAAAMLGAHRVAAVVREYVPETAGEAIA